MVPLASHGFNLSKIDFHDAVALHYGWPLHKTPQTSVCGQTFSVDHALICKRGSFICHRHNQVCDFTAGLLQEVCTHVVTEPELQPLTGEQLGRSANTEDTARLDIRASSFWGSSQDAFCEIRVFYPFAPSYRYRSVASLYREHEQKKWLEYGQRVCVTLNMIRSHHW